MFVDNKSHIVRRHGLSLKANKTILNRNRSNNAETMVLHTRLKTIFLLCIMLLFFVVCNSMK